MIPLLHILTEWIHGIINSTLNLFYLFSLDLLVLLDPSEFPSTILSSDPSYPFWYWFCNDGWNRHKLNVWKLGTNEPSFEMKLKWLLFCVSTVNSNFFLLVGLNFSSGSNYTPTCSTLGYSVMTWCQVRWIIIDIGHSWTAKELR